MPRFKVTATYSMILYQKAVIEIDALNIGTAYHIAAEMNQQGKLPWLEDGCDQPEPTNYDVELMP